MPAVSSHSVGYSTGGQTAPSVFTAFASSVSMFPTRNHVVSSAVCAVNSHSVVYSTAVGLTAPAVSSALFVTSLTSSALFVTRKGEC